MGRLVKDPMGYVLTDYKSSGNFKVAKWLGIKSETVEETLLLDGKPILLKSGPNMGMPRTKKHQVITTDPSQIDIKDVTLQLNRYRIFYEQKGFHITRLQVMAIPRDGGTWLAKKRGITESFYVIPIKRLPNNVVLKFYKHLSEEVNEAFKTGYARPCDNWESWDKGRCEKWCEVKDACIEMSKQNGETWGIL